MINQALQLQANHNSTFNASDAGKFYIVATPIGNIKDITIRALDVLRSVDVIVCEDTRVTAKLLMHYDIKKRMIVYNDHSSSKDRNKIIELLTLGESIALVSDAGTPGIADPGYDLINAVKDAGITMTSLPGPCSAINALILSGLPSDTFTFFGFLPHNEISKQNLLKELRNHSHTLIFFESARRLVSTLNVMLSIFGDRKIAMAKELTKIFETVHRDTISSQIKYWESSILKGEFVMIIDGMRHSETTQDDIYQHLKALLSRNISLKDAASIISETFDINRKIIYKLALRMLSGN